MIENSFEGITVPGPKWKTLMLLGSLEPCANMAF